MSKQHIEVPGQVVRGHGVASGKNHSPEFPQGTLVLQAPFFSKRGLDLSGFHLGTINLSIAPKSFKITNPKYCFRQVAWEQNSPAEDFSFVPCQLRYNSTEYPACIYYPHPETKPCHFQDPATLEILAPFIEGISYGAKLSVILPQEQIEISG